MRTESTRPIPGQSREATILHARVDKIIDLIPQDFSGREIAVHALRGEQHSILYTAPSAMFMRWNEFARILEHHIPCDSKWSEEIAVVFGKEIEE